MDTFGCIKVLTMFWDLKFILQGEWQILDSLDGFKITRESQYSQVMIEAKQSGFVKCSAENKRGHVTMQQQFLVTGIKDKQPGGGTHMLDATGVWGRRGYLFHNFMNGRGIQKNWAAEWKGP